MRDLVWTVWDDFLDASWGGRVVRVGAALAALTVVAGSLTLVVLAGGTDRETPEDRLSVLAEGLRTNPEQTMATLPSWAVGRFDGLDGERFQGTLATFDSEGGCVGLEVVVGSSWVLDGDTSAIEVSEPTVLDLDRCKPADPSW